MAFDWIFLMYKIMSVYYTILYRLFVDYVNL